MAKRSHDAGLQRAVKKLATKHSPDDVLHELSVMYEEFSVAGQSEPEVEFWLKCSKATSNISSGMNKWMHEMVEDAQEEGEE